MDISCEGIDRFSERNVIVIGQVIGFYINVFGYVIQWQKRKLFVLLYL